MTPDAATVALTLLGLALGVAASVGAGMAAARLLFAAAQDR
ncbi:MAG TPA: hypothetical protein VFV20_04220 [Candidatus Limnocylindria bacterium]|nr:hypothetical protein [Candidatus Limnocylindria bacterium]